MTRHHNPASPKNIRKRMFPRKRNHDSRRCRCVVISRAFHRAVLQLCRSGLICCANAPCVIGFRSVQGEAIRNRKSSFWRFLRFSLSYRDVEELLAERGLHADHVTVWRWVQRYAPVMERRLRSRLRPTNDSWRVDETYIRVKGKWVYLYFLLSAKRDAAAAERFSRQGFGRREPSGAAGHQHRQARRLCAGDSATQS